MCEGGGGDQRSSKTFAKSRINYSSLCIHFGAISVAPKTMQKSRVLYPIYSSFRKDFGAISPRCAPPTQMSITFCTFH